MLNLERMRFQIEVKITFSSLSILEESDLASMIVFARSNRRGRQTGYPWHQLEYATGVGGFHGIPLGAPRAEKG
jgi:hypothetical protein